MPRIASWATVSSCVRSLGCRPRRCTSPCLPRFAYPNVPRTGSPLCRVGGTVIRSVRSIVMQRFVLLSFLALALACGGHQRPPATRPTPEPALPPAPVEAGTPAPAPDRNDALLLPPAPMLDTLVPADELAAEL